MQIPTTCLWLKGDWLQDGLLSLPAHFFPDEQRWLQGHRQLLELPQ